MEEPKAGPGASHKRCGRLDHPRTLIAPNPLPNAEMMRTLRRICGVPFGLPATDWMLEIGAFVLRTETELLIKSRRVIPGRLLDSGFEFQFPAIETAFEDLLKSTTLASAHSQAVRPAARAVACPYATSRQALREAEKMARGSGGEPGHLSR